MSISKAQRARKQHRERNRLYRERKRQAAELQQQAVNATVRALEESARQRKQAEDTARSQAESFRRRCVECNAPHANCSIGGQDYCVEHGARRATAPASAARTESPAAPDAPPLPPRRYDRPEPVLFDPSSDRFRPPFWDVIDPKPEPIRLPLNPRAVRAIPPIAGDGQFTVEPNADPGFTFSEAEGHIDVTAELEKQAELEWQQECRRKR